MTWEFPVLMMVSSLEMLSSWQVLMLLLHVAYVVQRDQNEAQPQTAYVTRMDLPELATLQGSIPN